MNTKEGKYKTNTHYFKIIFSGKLLITQKIFTT